MKVRKITPKDGEYPEKLKQIASPPKILYVIGTPLDELSQSRMISIVGSRKVTPYGRQMTKNLASQLAEMGIVIVSGLALGVDSIAHEAVLEAKGKTIAVLPSGLDTIYPVSHTDLARRILRNGGTLVTEYPENTTPFQQNFVARNRIVSGLSDGVLITEAAEKSGSLHTAKFALEQGREVMAVPGNVTSPTSVGTNNLIKSGAALVSDASDVLGALGVNIPSDNRKPDVIADTEAEFNILTLINNGVNDSDELFTMSELTTSEFGQTLTMLEIKGVIKSSGGQWHRT